MNVRRSLNGFAAAALIYAAIGVHNIAAADTYTYDAQGRLASVTSDTGVVTHYCYDAAGNRTYIGPTACP